MSAHPHPRPAAPPLTLANLLVAAQPYIADGPFAPNTRGVLARLALCRSGAFGYAQLACPCGHAEWRPRGCGLRHCPGCGRTRTEEWIADRKLELLECPYHQLVFTLPPPLYPLTRDNPTLLYDLLFEAVRDTLLELAADPRHLGGIPQLLMALHTWNGRLDFHVHLHVLMAAGAYAPVTDVWIPAKHRDFLFPVGILSALFRGRFLAGLKRLAGMGGLRMDNPALHPLREPAGWNRFLDGLYQTPFFTYVDKPAAGPANVLEYLGHYLQRTGLSNNRLVSLADGQVTFLCKDRKKKRSTTCCRPRKSA